MGEEEGDCLKWPFALPCNHTYYIQHRTSEDIRHPGQSYARGAVNTVEVLLATQTTDRRQTALRQTNVHSILSKEACTNHALKKRCCLAMPKTPSL